MGLDAINSLQQNTPPTDSTTVKKQDPKEIVVMDPPKNNKPPTDEIYKLVEQQTGKSPSSLSDEELRAAIRVALKTYNETHKSTTTSNDKPQTSTEKTPTEEKPTRTVVNKTISANEDNQALFTRRNEITNEIKNGRGTKALMDELYQINKKLMGN